MTSNQAMLKSILIVAGLLIQDAVIAQINESDTLLLQYTTSWTGSLQTGNLDAFAVRAKADFSVAPTKFWAFKTQNAYRYQAFFQRKADNDFFSRNFAYLRPQGKVYPFLIAFFSTNYRRKIDFRYFTGAGATWQLVRSQSHILKVSLSGVYESTRFAGNTYNYPAYDGYEHIETWRATAWISGKNKFFGERLRVYYELYAQPSLKYNNNFRWQAEAGLEWPLWKGLSIAATYLFTHENVVISSVKRSDGLLTFGIAWSGKTGRAHR